jgi:peptide/nickel transport system permease protein
MADSAVAAPAPSAPIAPGSATGPETVRTSLRARRVRLPLRGQIGVVMTATVVLVAVFAPLLAPHPFDDQDLARSLLPPAWLPGADASYPLGTDYQGRDLLSRVIFGARTSLAVGAAAVVLAGMIGVSLGLVAGFFRGWTDDVLMRLADAQLAFPPIVLAVSVLSVVGPSPTTIVVLLGVMGWVQYARVIRGQTLSLRESDFVTAARALGAGNGRIVLRHILPNALGPVLVIAALNMSAMILAEASLSFLGLGVRPPIPAWGSMLSEARDVFSVAWWTAVFPGLAIVWTVFGINLLGDGSRSPSS